MSYNKTTWTDGVTPLSATNLNKIEDGLVASAGLVCASVSNTAMSDIGHDTLYTLEFDTNEVTSSIITHSTSTNKDRINLTVAGEYFITANVYIENYNDYGECYTALYNNSTQIAKGTDYSINGATFNISTVITAAANDIIRVKVYTESPEEDFSNTGRAYVSVVKLT